MPDEEVGHGHAHLLRPTPQVVALTGDAHEAACALDGVVVAGPFAVGAGLTIPRDAAIHQARIERLQGVEVQAVTCHVADLEVLDEHVAVRHQPFDDALALRPAKYRR